jgi:uncharacterized protein (UPF0147 family)
MMGNMTGQIIELTGIVGHLNEVQEDSTVPKNVRTKIQQIIVTLQDKTEVSIKVNKAIDVLDEISNDVNLHSYTRTQLWNAISVLEKLNHNFN